MEESRNIKTDAIDDIKYELFYQASLIELGIHLDIQLVQKLFDSLIEHGIYSDTFIAILYPDDNYTSETVTRALKAITFPIPEDEQKAIDFMIQYHLKRIVEEKEDIFEELGGLGHLYSNDGEFDIFGAAKPLYEECYHRSNEYPFCTDDETEEETAELVNDLFEIAKRCYSK